MDIRDDLSTTTTTDYDSGDSEGVDYVYEQRKTAERKATKSEILRRKGPKGKHRSVASRACGAVGAEGDAEITVSEDTDTGVGEDHGRLPHRTRLSQPEVESMSNCGVKDHLCHIKTGRSQTPYIEEYPHDAPRPAILLKEHRISRFSAFIANRVLDSEHLSLSKGSPGRSPAGKRLSRWPPRRRSVDSSQHSGQYRRRFDPPEIREDGPAESDFLNTQSRPGSRIPILRRSHQEHYSELVSAIARRSNPTGIWDSQPNMEYSSSWPLHLGSHQRHKRLRRRDQEYDTGEDIEEEKLNNDSTYGAHHRPTHSPAHSSRGGGPERGESPRQEMPQLQARLIQARRRDEHEHRIPPPHRLRPYTVASRDSMSNINQGHRSVATSLCEVWRGQVDDWESPFASASDDDFDPDIEKPIRILRTENLPLRRFSPRLLPSRGQRRGSGF
ncbi:hypothetical protein N657DRAFT_357908 [Parathielavia appendiculata]|uniref:Uncharacterized protein n=1 Tax=Parathielavia appendiculata TaxID=2587402 RepID=A0AAN6U3J6_9PEZI|nr:hypothetical protein N657DRAFT_357908 [Parathielavia appendiculata]